MITKKLFVDVLKNIQKQEKRVSKFSKALGEICDGHPVFDTDNLYLKSLLDILKVTFDDRDDYITWWLWEDVEKKVWLQDGVEIDLKTPEKLYDFLVDNMNNKTS